MRDALIWTQEARLSRCPQKTAEDRAAWAKAIPNIAAEWAQGLDGKGEADTDMLSAYLGKLDAAGYTGVRDWSLLSN